MTEKQRNIVFDNGDGSLSLTHCPTEEIKQKLLEREIIPENGYIEFPVDDTEESILCKSDIHMEFFECWQFDKPEYPTEIIINMDKAKKQWMEHLRILRDERLSYIDRQLVIALGDRDEDRIEKLTTIKQGLRDMPQRINISAVNNITDLKDLVPAILFAE